MRKQALRWAICLIALGALLIGVSIFSLCVGAVNISSGDILKIIFGGKGTAGYDILFNIRLPRILLGFAIGGALSLAGVISQGMFRNPLVEPYTLGLSGGAALGVCLNIILRLKNPFGIPSLPLCGFLGSALVIAIVYFLSRKKGALKMQGLLLTGVMISFICSSLVMLIMALSRSEDLHGIVFWIMGSLEEPNRLLIKAALAVSVTGLFISYIFCKDLNVLALGEEEAAHLGVNVERVKLALFLLASLLTGASVAVAGIIGFVGLTVPHLVRMALGQDHRIVLAASFLTGGVFLILCDTLARTIITPLELPVGVITGILGGSIFVWALTKSAAAPGER
ncbi:MAG: iron ABC transporter permease [Candidatus Omnitrophica bacterium]|nr:iron ABC transporter permease [Candidatus Omnitrophota bacterium]